MTPTYTARIIVLIMLFCAPANCQVVINEFLADPKSPLESEWIELYNLSDSEIDLLGWNLCDPVGCAVLDDFSIDAGEYLILCEDSEAFSNYYSEFTGRLIEINGWRALNNGGDNIILRRDDGITLDSVVYESGNGDNISWERIAYDICGWNSENWYPSLNEYGSTLGMINSVVEGFSESMSIYLERKLFSPGCNCPENDLPIKIEVPRDCYLTLTVYALDGRELAIICNEQALVSGTIYYDGRDSAGNYLNTGMYILLAETSGSCAGSEKLVFGVAK